MYPIRVEQPAAGVRSTVLWTSAGSTNSCSSPLLTSGGVLPDAASQAQRSSVQSICRWSKNWKESNFFTVLEVFQIWSEFERNSAFGKTWNKIEGRHREREISMYWRVQLLFGNPHFVQILGGSHSRLCLPILGTKTHCSALVLCRSRMRKEQKRRPKTFQNVQQVKALTLK